MLNKAEINMLNMVAKKGCALDEFQGTQLMMGGDMTTSQPSTSFNLLGQAISLNDEHISVEHARYRVVTQAIGKNNEEIQSQYFGNFRTFYERR